MPTQGLFSRYGAQAKNSGILRAAPKTSRIERQYALQLNQIAQNIQGIVATVPAYSESALQRVIGWLGQYGKELDPWANKAAATMLEQVQAEDYKQWVQLSKRMGKAIHVEISTAPTGELTRQLLADQVELITSLPKESALRIQGLMTKTVTAERVHEMALANLSSSTRADSIFAEIMKSGEVAGSRARTIARTETSRASETFTQARAKHIGSPGYFWRTSKDGDVRPSHKKMEGQFVPWDDPPTLDGYRAHAGCIFNCRCYAEPALPN